MSRPKKNMLTIDELDKLADELMEEAKKRGVSDSYFFQTTFERYLMQLDILKKLGKAIKEQDTLVTKVYVKERENIAVNPAISEYNKTATAANGTVTTLMRIFTANGDKIQADESADPMMLFRSELNAHKKI
jgi:hypothetical protein